MAKQGYEEVVCAIIRPPRAEYDISDLGPKSFMYCGRQFERRDIELTNTRGLKLACSHWEPVEGERPAKELPCVVYLHGNSSCRAGCLDSLEVVLGVGATMFALDFAGSGMSGGDYVTLGEYEKDDVAAVIEHLRTTGRVSAIGLWGRSMGAATALLHSHRDPSIACIILDSPFADLRQLANEMVAMGKEQAGFRVPGFVIKTVIKMVQQSVLKRAKMDINKLKPIENVDKAFVPALFCHGEHDNFIGVHHSREIAAKYAGDKNLVVVPGDHNSMRPPFFHHSAAIFLKTTMRIPDEYALEGDMDSRPNLLKSWSRGRGGRSALELAALGIDPGDSDGESDLGARQRALEEEMIRRAIAASVRVGGTSGSKPKSSGSGSAGVAEGTSAALPESLEGPPTTGFGGAAGLMLTDDSDSETEIHNGVSMSALSLGSVALESGGASGRASATVGGGAAPGSAAAVAPPSQAAGSSPTGSASPDVMALGSLAVVTPPHAAVVHRPRDDWACAACTFVNTQARTLCEICGTAYAPDSTT